MKHERETLEAVTEARNTAAAAAKAVASDPTNGRGDEILAGAEGAVGAAQHQRVDGSHPDLKASQNMMQVQEELTSTENKVALARQAYNDSVMQFNVQRDRSPTHHRRHVQLPGSTDVRGRGREGP